MKKSLLKNSIMTKYHSPKLTWKNKGNLKSTIEANHLNKNENVWHSTQCRNVTTYKLIDNTT